MGVKGLWKLIEDAGYPTPLESLEHKILAVDVSIWLHQSVHGFKGRGVDVTANAHLLTLFHRICKLFFYRIKPVFVFDGGVPNLKKQTMSFRQIRREAAADRAQQVRKRLLKNLLKSHAVRNVLGHTGPIPSDHRVLPAEKPRQKDMFELPPLPEGVSLETDSVTEMDKELKGVSSASSQTLHCNLHDFDYDSENFIGLPLQKRHEILVDLQDSRKDNSWKNINDMPDDYDDFSSFQMKRLLKRNRFQETINDVRSKLQKAKAEEIEREMFGDLENIVSQTHKVVSEDAVHSIILTRNVETVDLKNEEVKACEEEAGKKIDIHSINILNNFLNTEGAETILEQISDSEDETAESSTVDEDSLLKVMNCIMEHENGVSQDEIYSIIQQTKEEVDVIFPRKKDPNEPSTSNMSRSISPSIVHENSSDEDDDDFIEVPAVEEIAAAPPEQELSKKSHNMDALMSPSSMNSLYLKIVQQKLDDVAHQEKSPKKALVDSRNMKNFETTNKMKNVGDQNTSIVVPKLLIDVNLDGVNQVDDIFADIFSEKSVPRKTSNKKLIKKSSTKQNNKIVSNKPEGGNSNSVVEVNEKIVENEAIAGGSKEKCISIPTNVKDYKEKIEELVKLQISQMIENSVIQLPLNENITKKNRVDSIGKATSPIILDEEEVTEDQNFVQVVSTSENNGTLESLKSKSNETFSAVSDKPTCSPDTEGTQESTNLNELQSSVFENQEMDDIEKEDALAAKSNIEPDSHIDKQIIPSTDELKQLEKELGEERNSLVAQVGTNERIASNLSQQTYTDAQELLQLFGLPYIVAPMEAEAQCAFLDEAGLTNGTITDDSDAFLFGSKHVYKNFFNQNKHMEYFKAINIEHKYGLHREKLICLALLTGSDYTEGIGGVGAVGGMEIITEFLGEGMEVLVNFKKWWKANTSGVSNVRMSKIREKLLKLYIPDGFPNIEVYKAYTSPTIDESREKFEWSVPNINGIREFTAEKFGWSRLKTDEILLPVLKRLKVNSSQIRIDSFFHNVKLTKQVKIQSKRLKQAVAKSRGDVAISENITSGSKTQNRMENIKAKHHKVSKKVIRSEKAKSRAKTKNIMEDIKANHLKERKRLKPSSSTESLDRILKQREKVMRTSTESEELTEPAEEVSKEEKKLENFKNLYRKDEISQSKMDEEAMKEKKRKAADLLKKRKKM